MPHDHDEHRAPTLVLGLGNLLLHDDGVGLELLKRLRPTLAGDRRVECLDGGTLGLALLPHVGGRRALLVLDAVRLDDEPGTIHIITGDETLHPQRGTTAHESSAGELLTAASLLGELPEAVAVVGVEPADMRTGIGLSALVRGSLPGALEAAERCLADLLEETHQPKQSCTS